MARMNAGKGSNPNSRANLKVPARNTYVFNSENNEMISGPHFFKVAYKKAVDLNRKFSTNRYFADSIEKPVMKGEFENELLRILL